MINVNKTTIFILFILGIIIIAGCVKVTKTASPPPTSQPNQVPTQTAPQQPETTRPATSPPSAPSAPAAQAPQFTDINSVKCDGQSYNLLIKPKHSIMWITVEAVNKQKILDLKSEGLIQEFVEVIKNVGAYSIPTKQTYKGETGGGSGEMGVLPGWTWFIVDVKEENAKIVNERIQVLREIKVGTGYSGYGLGNLWSNSGDKDTSFEFTCRIPTGPGRIIVYSNIEESSFTLTGPATYTGKGACWQVLDAPPGEYTFTFDDVSGYTKPGKMLSSGLKMSLVPESHLMFGATYATDTPANTGAIIVITNIPESTFTITGPATYSGKGSCWAQTNAPLGQYEINFNDVAGYESPFFKKDSVSISSGFPLGTSSKEYKKIGS